MTMRHATRLPTLVTTIGLLVLSLAGCERAAQSPTDNAPADKAPISRAVHSNKPRVIAYYFHRELRCATCLSIEKQAREALQTGYSADLKSGRLEWCQVNIDEQENKHFEEDFELETSSLVLVAVDGNRTQRWELLVDVWDLVDNPLGFQQFVWAEVDEFLESLPGSDAPDEATP